jgi:hypothetical protein
MHAKSQPWLPAVGLLLALPCLACDALGDGTNDYDCEATWSREGEVLSKENYEYLKMPNEFEATRRCKQEMLENVPRGGKLAECKCVGRKSQHVLNQ